MSKRVLAQGLSLAFLCSVCVGAPAAAETITLEPRYSASYGTKIFDYVKSIDKDMHGDAVLTLTVFGDLDEPDENFQVYLDYTLVLGTFLDNDAGNDEGGLAGDAGALCQPQTVSIPIREADLEPFTQDGALSIKIVTSSTVSKAGANCPAGSGQNISAQVSGSLTYTSQASYQAQKNRETVSAAESLSSSRTSVTMANLPSLANRLARGGFRGGGVPGAGGLPGGGVPGGGLPGGGTPGGGLPGGGAPSPVSGAPGFAGSLSGAGDASQGYLNLSGDLDGLRRAAAARFSGSEGGVAALNVNDGRLPFDVWFGGSYTYFDASTADIRQTGDIATMQFGVDTRLNDRWLVGVAAFGDLLLSDVSTGADTTGLGFLTGPYAVVSLDENVYVEAMAAVGRAYNRIETPGQDDARFESDRLLLTGRVSGDWTHGAWSFRPSSRLTYYAERQEAFADGTGSIAPERTAVLGQLRFGPEIAYDVSWEDSGARPYLGVEGVWAFRQTDQLVDGVPVSDAPFTGSLALGLDGRWGRTTFRAGGRYDGLGDGDLSSVTGELTVRIPID